MKSKRGILKRKSLHVTEKGLIRTSRPNLNEKLLLTPQKTFKVIGHGRSGQNC